MFNPTTHAKFQFQVPPRTQSPVPVEAPSWYVDRAATFDVQEHDPRTARATSPAATFPATTADLDGSARRATLARRPVPRPLRYEVRPTPTITLQSTDGSGGVPSRGGGTSETALRAVPAAAGQLVALQGSEPWATE